MSENQTHQLATTPMDNVSKETAAGFLLLTIESLTAAAQDVDRAQRWLREAKQSLEREIRAAVKAGVPITHIARISGMSRQNVYLILRD